MNLDEARERVGNKVVYRAPHANMGDPGDEGVITSVNDRWVFVRYGTSTTSQATPPEALEPVSYRVGVREGQPRRGCGDFAAGGHKLRDPDCMACREMDSVAPEWTI